MLTGTKSLPASVGGMALGLAISLNAFSSPGIAMPKPKADSRGGHENASAEHLRWDPWAQAEYRDALATMLVQAQFPAFLMGTGSCLQVASVVVDVQSPDRANESFTVASDGILATSDIIATVRSILGLQITQLASILRVQRPTIYAWIDDRVAPHPQNQERLNLLYRFSRQWERMSDRSIGLQLRLMGEDGKSLLDLLSGDKINEPDVTAHLVKLSALKEVAAPPKRVPTVRELAMKHHISLPSEADRQLEIDRVTGKRTSME